MKMPRSSKTATKKSETVIPPVILPSCLPTPHKTLRKSLVEEGVVFGKRNVATRMSAVTLPEGWGLLVTSIQDMKVFFGPKYLVDDNGEVKAICSLDILSQKPTIKPPADPILFLLTDYLCFNGWYVALSSGLHPDFVNALEVCGDPIVSKSIYRRTSKKCRTRLGSGAQLAFTYNSIPDLGEEEEEN
jgi:hypothetical protein